MIPVVSFKILFSLEAAIGKTKFTFLLSSMLDRILALRSQTMLKRNERKTCVSGTRAISVEAIETVHEIRYHRLATTPDSTLATSGGTVVIIIFGLVDVGILPEVLLLMLTPQKL
jgi:hypothetical protein